MRLGKIMNRSALAVLALLCLLLSACRKDLCYNHFRAMNVMTQWEKAWERDYGRKWETNWNAAHWEHEYDEFLPGVPEGVTMIMYEDGKESSKNFFGPDGGAFMIGGGMHSMLIYNNDTRYIVFDDLASAPAAKASTTTRTRSSLKELHQDERTINPPDVLYGAYLSDIPEVQLHGSFDADVTMRPLVYTYLVRFGISKGAEYVSLARGALAGMAESVMMRDGSTSDDAATILFDCNVKEWGAEADVRSFGVAGFPDKYYGRASSGEGEDRHYTLNLEIMLRNGRMRSFNFDVTDQMADQPRGGIIEVGGIELGEEDISNDSGFDVNVSDWGEYEDIDLPIVH